MELVQQLIDGVTTVLRFEQKLADGFSSSKLTDLLAMLATYLLCVVYMHVCVYVCLCCLNTVRSKMNIYIYNLVARYSWGRPVAVREPKP